MLNNHAKAKSNDEARASLGSSTTLSRIAEDNAQSVSDGSPGCATIATQFNELKQKSPCMTAKKTLAGELEFI